MISTIPNRANGMDDIFTGKVVGRGYFGLSGRATTQGATFFEQFRPCGFMYCTIYATATNTTTNCETTSTVCTFTAAASSSATIQWTLKTGNKNYDGLQDTKTPTSGNIVAGDITTGSGTTVNTTEKGASNRTLKISVYSGTEANEDAYVEFPFTVATGYTFVPTKVTVKVANVSAKKTYDVVLSDNTSSTSTTYESEKIEGSVETIDWTIEDLVLRGSAKVRVYAYASDGGNNNAI